MRPRHVGVSLENRPKAAYTVSCREFLDRVGAHRLSTTQTFTPTVNTWTFDPTANPIKVCASDSLKKKFIVKHVWVFLSSFGVLFAALSWLYEMSTQGFWWKGALAVVLAFPVYRYFARRV